MTTEKIKCEICGAEVHAISIHIRDSHTDWTVEKYQETYPDAALMSELAKARIAERKAQIKAKDEPSASSTNMQPMFKLFGLNGRTKHSLRADGSPVMVETLPDGEWHMQVPQVDNNYVFNVEILKVMLMGIALRIPTYLWGHAGSGKTTILEEICARTNRPMIRIQHTGSTEESHILGQMAANKDGTYFEAGPLPMAMKYGWVYLADEYDFAFPQVLAVYQPVLEGKALVIKEAPADSEWRIVKPHPNFRIVATGNTNGAGDESNLYLGTNVQNSANYERFGVVEQMPYMEKKQEMAVVAAQGSISIEDAERLVKYAHLIRDAFDSRKIGATIGPRVLINAAKVGVARASFMKGLNNAFINRLTLKDREIATQLAQRVLE